MKLCLKVVCMALSIARDECQAHYLQIKKKWPVTSKTSFAWKLYQSRILFLNNVRIDEQFYLLDTNRP